MAMLLSSRSLQSKTCSLSSCPLPSSPRPLSLLRTPFHPLSSVVAFAANTSAVSRSIRALKQEREYLAKRVSSKLRADEIEMLYAEWEIPPVGKQRRLQLVNKLWTDPFDMENVRESAEFVAKIVGFCESGEHARKEMFELTFVNPSDKKTWMGWNLISNRLNL